MGVDAGVGSWADKPDIPTIGMSNNVTNKTCKSVRRLTALLPANPSKKYQHECP
jgi:hypothetical protein